jgi:hypothetical protein
MTKFVLIAALGAIASVSALGPDAVYLGTAGNYAIPLVCPNHVIQIIDHSKQQQNKQPADDNKL